jgi:hypothetical protein
MSGGIALLFLTWALDGVNGQLYVPADLLRGQEILQFPAVPAVLVPNSGRINLIGA